MVLWDVARGRSGRKEGVGFHEAESGGDFGRWKMDSDGVREVGRYIRVGGCAIDGKRMGCLHYPNRSPSLPPPPTHHPPKRNQIKLE